MAILNELLEEAATRATDLARQADEARASLEAVGAAATKAADTVRGESEEAHRGFQDLGAALESAEDRLEDAGQAAQGDLDDLRVRAAEVRARVAELLVGVNAAASELEAGKERLSGGLAQQLQDAVADSEQAARRLAEVRAAAQKKLEEASAAVRELSEEAAAAAQAIGDGQRQVTEALDELEAAAREQVKAYVDTMDAGLDSTADLRVELGNQLLREHNEAVVAVRQGLTEHAPAQVAAAVEPLKAAVEEVGALCAEGTGALPGRAAEVLEKVAEALETAERLRPALARRERLPRATE